MFEDALLDSATRPRRSRRGWTTLLSAAVQAAVVGVGILLPLLYTDALPTARLRATIYAPPAAGSPPRASDAVAAGRGGGAPLAQSAQLTAPPRIPERVADIVDAAPAGPAPHPSAIGIGGHGPGPGHPDGVIGGVPLPGTPPALPALQPPPAKANVSEGVMQGFLIRQVQPTYPRAAQQLGVQGEVVLRAVISRAGVIEDLQVVSGHPLLAPAAAEAVRQWRYRPYLLNRQPVEVETEVRVVFRLNR
jgi:periplasmic protein TonB